MADVDGHYIEGSGDIYDALVLWEQGAVTTSLSGLSPAAGALGATYETARFQPIALTVEVPSGFGPLIFAEIGEASAFPLVVYDPVAADFTPLFRDESTATDNGDGTWTFSLLPLGGWWRDDVTITPGIFAEAT